MNDPAPLGDVKRAARTAQRALERRDQSIVNAHNDGRSLRAIARAAGLTHPAIIKIIERNTMDDYATIPEAAEVLGLTTREVWDLINDEQLVIHKVGGRQVIKRADLEGVPTVDDH